MHHFQRAPMSRTRLLFDRTTTFLIALIVVSCSTLGTRAGEGSGSGTMDTSGSGAATVGAGGEGGSDQTDAGSSSGGAAGTDIDTTDGSTVPPPGTDDAGDKGCLGDQAMSTACDLDDAGCGSVLAYCQRLSSLLKPAVAAQAISCINLVARCSSPDVARCVKVALFSACADPAADASCDQVSQLCANSIPTTAEECHNFLNGMTSAGRQAVLACLASSDAGPACSQGVFACIRAL